MMNKIINPHIRWLIRRDLEEVLEIDKLSFDPLVATEEDFIKVLSVKDSIGKVIELDNKIVAFMILTWYKEPYRTTLRTLAVHPGHRREGIGQMLLENVLNKRDFGKLVITNVPEHCLGGQLFLREFGFVCTSTNPDGSYRFVRKEEYNGPLRYRSGKVH